MKNLLLISIILIFISSCILTKNKEEPVIIKTLIIQENIPNGKIFRYDDTGHKQVTVQEDEEMTMELATNDETTIVKELYKVEASIFGQIEKELNSIQMCDSGPGVNIKLIYSNSKNILEYKLPFFTNCYPKSVEEVMTKLEELYDWN